MSQREDQRVQSEYFLAESQEKAFNLKHAGPFRIGRLLGKGTTGIVRIGTHIENGFQVALKIIKKKQLLTNPDRWKTLRREIAVMKLIDHRHVIKLYDVFETEEKIFLVTELAKGGELFDYIREGSLPREEALQLLAQITQGLLHCHQHCIVHRDLKPENLLLDESRNVKIADFGMAQLMKKGDFLKTSCGSPHYASPEVISEGKYDGKRSDVWSLGVILYAMVTGTLPFDHEHVPTLLKIVQQGVYEIPDFVDEDIADLLQAMIKVDYNERIRMEDIQHHRVFKGTKYFPSLSHSFSLSSLAHYNPRGVPSGSPLRARRHSDSTLATLDENVLEDIVALLGFESREELRGKILEPDANIEKALYGLLVGRKSTRLEALSRLSPHAMGHSLDSPLFFSAATVSTTSSGMATRPAEHPSRQMMLAPMELPPVGKDEKTKKKAGPGTPLSKHFSSPSLSQLKSDEEIRTMSPPLVPPSPASFAAPPSSTRYPSQQTSKASAVPPVPAVSAARGRSSSSASSERLRSNSDATGPSSKSSKSSAKVEATFSPVERSVSPSGQRPSITSPATTGARASISSLSPVSQLSPTPQTAKKVDPSSTKKTPMESTKARKPRKAPPPQTWTPSDFQAAFTINSPPPLGAHNRKASGEYAVPAAPGSPSTTSCFPSIRQKSRRASTNSTEPKTRKKGFMERVKRYSKTLTNRSRGERAQSMTLPTSPTAGPLSTPSALLFFDARPSPLSVSTSSASSSSSITSPTSASTASPTSPTSPPATRRWFQSFFRRRPSMDPWRNDKLGAEAPYPPSSPLTPDPVPKPAEVLRSRARSSSLPSNSPKATPVVHRTAAAAAASAARRADKEKGATSPTSPTATSLSTSTSKVASPMFTSSTSATMTMTAKKTSSRDFGDSLAPSLTVMSPDKGPPPLEKLEAMGRGGE